jgi:type II secretory pathway predicted ATPase ExeA
MVLNNPIIGQSDINGFQSESPFFTVRGNNVTVQKSIESVGFQLFSPISPRGYKGQFPLHYPHTKDIDLPKILQSYVHHVQNNDIEGRVAFYRNLVATNGYKDSITENAKKECYGIYTSCIFKDTSTASSHNIEKYIPTFCIDIDPKSELKKDCKPQFTNVVDSFKAYILSLNDPYISIVHKSVSIYGLCVWVKFPTDAVQSEHNLRCLSVIEYFTTILSNFDLFNLFDIDIAVTNINRTRILSYDKDVFFNPNAIAYEGIKEPTIREKRENLNFDNDNDIDFVDFINTYGTDIYAKGRWIYKKHNNEVCGSINDQTIKIYASSRVDGLEPKGYNIYTLRKHYGIEQTKEKFDKYHGKYNSKGQKKKPSKIVVKDYLTENFEVFSQLKTLIFCDRVIGLNAPVNSGKSFFCRKLVNEMFFDGSVIVALPTITTVQENAKEFANGFIAVTSEDKNINDAPQMNKIVCCFASLWKILSQKIAAKERIFLIVDEFHDLHKNMDNKHFELFLEQVRTNENLKVLFVSATINERLKKEYGIKIIEVEKENVQKELIKIVFAPFISKAKKQSQRNYIQQFIKYNKKHGYKSSILIEDKNEIDFLAKEFESYGYKVECLHRDTENKRTVTNRITAEEWDFDILLHTSSLKAGTNIIQEGVRMLVINGFHVEGNQKVLNVTDLTQLFGRLRNGIKDLTIYWDGNPDIAKDIKHCVSYHNWKQNLCLDSFSFEHIIECGQIHKKDFREQFVCDAKNPYISTKELLLQHEIIENSNMNFERFFEAFPNAEITIEQFEFCKDVGKIKPPANDLKEYKEKLLTALDNNHNSVFNAFLDAKILEKIETKLYPCEPDQSVIELVSDNNAKASSVISLLNKYDWGLVHLGKEKVAVFMNMNSEQQSIIKDRYNSQERHSIKRKYAFNNNINTRLTDVEKAKVCKDFKFANSIYKHYKSGGVYDKDSLIELSQKKEMYGYRKKYCEILYILNTYFNIQCTTKELLKCHKVNSKTEFYEILFNTSTVTAESEVLGNYSYDNESIEKVCFEYMDAPF